MVSEAGSGVWRLLEDQSKRGHSERLDLSAGNSMAGQGLLRSLQICPCIKVIILQWPGIKVGPRLGHTGHARGGPGRPAVDASSAAGANRVGPSPRSCIGDLEVWVYNVRGMSPLAVATARLAADMSTIHVKGYVETGWGGSD